MVLVVVILHRAAGRPAEARSRRADAARDPLQRARGGLGRDQRRPGQADGVRARRVHRRGRRRSDRLHAGRADADSFAAFTSISLLAIVFVAGVGRIAGAVVAGIMFSAAGLFVTFLDIHLSVGKYQAIVAGVALVLTAVQNPDGLTSTATGKGPAVALMKLRDRVVGLRATGAGCRCAGGQKTRRPLEATDQASDKPTMHHAGCLICTGPARPARLAEPPAGRAPHATPLGIGTRGPASLVVAARARRARQLGVPHPGRQRLGHAAGSRAGESVLVDYVGPALRPAQRVTWQVKVWTEAGESDWSDRQALRARAARRAATGRRAGSRRSSPSCRRRGGGRRCSCAASSSSPACRSLSARLYATAHGIYEAFVNGRRVGDAELTPGFTEYRDRLQVQTYDITGAAAARAQRARRDPVRRLVSRAGRAPARPRPVGHQSSRFLAQLRVPLRRTARPRCRHGPRVAQRSVAHRGGRPDRRPVGRSAAHGRRLERARASTTTAGITSRSPTTAMERLVDLAGAARAARCRRSNRCRCAGSRAGRCSTSARTSTAGCGCATSGPRAPRSRSTHGEALDADGDVTTAAPRRRPAVPPRAAAGGPGRPGRLGGTAAGRVRAPPHHARLPYVRVEGHPGELGAERSDRRRRPHRPDAHGLVRVQRRAHQPTARGGGLEPARQRLRHPDRLPDAGARRAGPATGRSSSRPPRSSTTSPGSPPSGCATWPPSSGPTGVVANLAPSPPARVRGRDRWPR